MESKALLSKSETRPTNGSGSLVRLRSSKKRSIHEIKPDPMLVKLAKQQGIDIAKSPKRKKGESLLDWRRRVWNIPAITHQPLGTCVIVWRLPPIELSPGGLYVPMEAQSPNFKGVLLAWGLEAQEYLESHGFELGHIVIWGRFDGWEHNDNTQKFGRRAEVIELERAMIKGSEDVLVAEREGRLIREKDEKGKIQYIKVKKISRKLTAQERRKLKLRALSKGTANEHEARAAKNIAARMK